MLQNTVNTSAEFTALFNRANIILSACVLRADMLRAKAGKIKHSKNVNTWIARMNEKDNLLNIADRTETRGRKVWGCITDFKGKYVNYRHITTDNTPIFDIILNAGSKYEQNLPTAKKLAGIF